MSETKMPEKKKELTDEQLAQVAGGVDALPVDPLVIVDNHIIHHVVTDVVPDR